MTIVTPPLPTLLDEKRSAHATLRGFLYQTCLGVQRWLDLQPGEALLCEGDEDLDVLGRRSVSEQVKAYSGELGLADQTVLKSLRQFLRSYVTLRRRGETRRFLFTTTAQQKRPRRGSLSYNLLVAWQNGERGPYTCEEVRSLVESAEVAEAVAWLDAEPEGWKGFLDAVEWTFGAPDLDKVRDEIRRQLAAHPVARNLPAETFIDRLVFEVFAASSRREVRDRLLTQDDLSRLAETARTELGTWERSEPARRIREVFDEVAQIGRLLHDNTAELPSNPSPGKLLTAAYEVVLFEEAGRREELEALETWCNGEDPRSVLLLTGEGGSGKTRLAIEWCRRLRHQGWHAGFLRRDREGDALDPLLQGMAPRLVVIDYAETRLGIVEPLLYKMGIEPDGGPKVRLLLLARRAGDWWEGLSRGTAENRVVEDLLHRSPPPRLITPLISDDPEERIESFVEAARGFAVQLNISKFLLHPDLNKEGFERPLYLHMAALAALLDRPVETARQVLDETLRHERLFWSNQIDELNLDRSLEKYVEGSLGRAVAALTLVGGAAGEPQARALLGRVLDPFPARPDFLDTILDLLRRLYGGSQFLEPLQPDILGEQLVAEHLARDPGLLAKVLDGATPEEGYGVLTVLTRLAQRRPEGGEWLKVAFHGRLEQLAEIALDVAVETGDPIGMVLAREIEEDGTEELARRLMKRCSEGRFLSSLHLREAGLAATQKTWEFLESRHRSDEDAPSDEKDLAERAEVANNLGNRLHELGRREEALHAIQMAAELYRQLAEHYPDEFLPYLAISLDNLGVMLRGLGRYEEAVQATQEAVQLNRQLTKHFYIAFLPKLAHSLNNLGAVLRDLGRGEEALHATHEAMKLRRQLAARLPDVFLPELATSLHNLGAILRDLGRHEEAFQATHEAVQIYRQLVEGQPDAYLPDLAGSLRNLDAMLRDLGHHEEALQTAQEAVQIHRQLADRRPDVFLPNLASSLNNLGAVLGDLGRWEEAFQTYKEAVQTLAPSFLRYPAAFGSWMIIFGDNYLQAAETVGQEPDAELLEPIIEILKAQRATESEEPGAPSEPQEVE